MKTSSAAVIVFVLALTGIIDASSRGSKKSSANEDPPHIPTHFLLQYNPYAGATAASNVDSSESEVDNSDNDDKAGSSSSIRDIAIASGSILKSGVPLTRETSADMEQIAVSALVDIANRNCDESFELESFSNTSDSRKNMARKVHRHLAYKAQRLPAKPKLKKFTQTLFKMGKIKKADKYFDESNISTEGKEWLMKCFHSSLNFDLAADLIAKGARLPVSEETFSGIFSIEPGHVDSEISVSILMELIKVDPEQAVAIFLGAADVTEDQEKLDLFLMSVISEEDTAIVLCSSPQVSSILVTLIESGKFNSTALRIIEIMAVLGVQPREEDVIKIYGMAIESKNFQLVEAVLKQRWLDVHKRVFFGSSANYSPIYHLFGKFSSNLIMRLINEIGYNLAFTHDSVNNPNGDILLVAMFTNDLESFKRLLLAGACYDVKLNKSSGRLVTLEDHTRDRKPEYYAAIQSFKNGTLQAEIDN